MGMKPINERAGLTVKIPKTRQGYWDVMREMGTFRVVDVADVVKVPPATIGDFVRSLEAGGFLERVAEPKGLGEAIVYRIKSDQPAAPIVRRDGSPGHERLGTENMWRTIKMCGDGLDAHELHIWAGVAKATANRYLQRLAAAGYLMATEPGKPGQKPGTGRLTKYRLLPSMNTGPLAPQIQRIKAVWDPNRRTYVGEGHVEGADVDA